MTAGGSHCCKIARLVEEHRLAPPERFDGTFDDYLVAKWNGETGADPMGYRPLADWFNKRVLAAVYETHGIDRTTSEIDANYETLTGAERPARAELVGALEADGIDVGELTAAFVSKSTVARHISEHLGAEKDTAAAPAAVTDRLEFIRHESEQRLESVLRSLEREGRLAHGSHGDPDVALRVGCPHCAERVSIETALERGYICPDHLPATGPVDADATVDE